MELHGENTESEMFLLYVSAIKTILNWQRENYRVGTKLVVALSSQKFTVTENLVWIDEHTPFVTSSKYGETKSKAFELVRDYREKYNVRDAGAILFNHSSRFSRLDFVLMQIAKQIVVVLSSATDRIFYKFQCRT
jgi:GDP-D-mannose dehydratase